MQWPKLPVPGFLQREEYPDPVPLSDQRRSRFFSAFPEMDLTGDRSSDQPNVFQRMNQNTKDAFVRTRDGISNWASNANQAVRDRTYETWDAITRGFGPRSPSRSNESTDDQQLNQPVQPQYRSANRMGEPPKRY
jgi:hypothetical protein